MVVPFFISWSRPFYPTDEIDKKQAHSELPASLRADGIAVILPVSLRIKSSGSGLYLYACTNG